MAVLGAGGGLVKFVAAALIGLGVACQGTSELPRDPAWGKQTCSSCAMLISEPRFAAQLTRADGDPLYFDDVGCLVAFMAQRKNAGGQAWVRGAAGAWVQAKLAHFSQGAKTPMDYGFEFSEQGAFNWDAVQSAVRARLAKGSTP